MSDVTRIECKALALAAVIAGGFLLYHAFMAGQTRQATWECYEGENIAACDWLEEVQQ